MTGRDKQEIEYGGTAWKPVRQPYPIEMMTLLPARKKNKYRNYYFF